MSGQHFLSEGGVTKVTIYTLSIGGSLDTKPRKRRQRNVEGTLIT